MLELEDNEVGGNPLAVVAVLPMIAPVSLLLLIDFLFFDLFNLAFCFAFLDVNGKHSHEIDPFNK